MEDTLLEETAESIARRLGHADRFSVPFDPKPGSDFQKVWGPASDKLAIRAGLSLSTVESHGISNPPTPSQQNTVQVSREIPRIQFAGGLMAQVGKISGVLTILAASQIDIDPLRFVGYVAGAGEIIAGNAYLIGAANLIGGYAAVNSAKWMTFGRVVGGTFGGIGQIAISGYSAYKAIQAKDYTGAAFDIAAAIGGGLIVGAAIGLLAPAFAAIGAGLGVVALGFHAYRWIRS